MNRTEAVSVKAIEAIRTCCRRLGLKASGGSVGHHQIWARDTVISSLGARLVPDQEIQRALRSSIAVLAHRQAPTGEIPNNIDRESDVISWFGRAISAPVFGYRAVLRPSVNRVVSRRHQRGGHRAEADPPFCALPKDVKRKCPYSLLVN